MIYARLSYWYGLNFADIGAMPMAAIRAYLEALPRLQAEDELMIAEATALPQMDASARRRTLARLHRTARGGAREAKRATRRTLAQMGIGVGGERL